MVYPIENGFEAEHQRRIAEVEKQIRDEEAALSPEERQRKHEEEMLPRPFTGIMEPHLKEGSLVRVNTVGIRYQIGYLKGITSYGATFHPLDLQGLQKEKADLYIYLYSFLSPFAVNCNLFHHTTLSVRSHHECPLSVAPMDIFL